jgi:HEAT repeat protein
MTNATPPSSRASRLLEDPQQRIRDHARAALQELGVDARQEYHGLIDLLAHPAAYARSAALLCLGEHFRADSPTACTAAPSAVALLSDEDCRVRYCAATFIQGFSAGRLQELLAPRGRATFGLGGTSVQGDLLRIGMVLTLDAEDYESLARVRKPSVDPNPAVRLAALVVLGRLPRPPFDLLCPLLQDADPGVREFAISVALRARDPRAIPHFEDALTDPNADVRGSAAHALGLVRPVSVSSLRKVANLLKDPEPIVRFWACLSLGLAGPAAAHVLAALLEALDDPDADVRGRVIHVVALLRPRSAAVALRLLNLFGDPDDHNGSQAEQAVSFLLREIDDPGTVEAALRQTCKDPDERVRDRARNVLRALSEGAFTFNYFSAVVQAFSGSESDGDEAPWQA